MTEPESPLSPSALAQVPEVRKALSALTGVNYTFCVDRLPPSEDALLLAVRDATLKAERERLLAQTPEATIEAAAKAMMTLDLYNQSAQSAEGVWEVLLPENRGVYLDRVRAALPVLLAPEVAKREQVERELSLVLQSPNEHLRAAADLATRLGAAEAEVTRLREALKQYGRHLAHCATGYTVSEPCNCGLDVARAALGGKE